MRVSENRVQNAPLSARISDPLGVHTPHLNRMSNAGPGESSVHPEREDFGVALSVSGRWL